MVAEKTKALKKRIKVRFIKDFKAYDIVHADAKVLLPAYEIFVDAELKRNPKVLQETLKHELKHFEIFERLKHNRSLFLLETLWLELKDSPKFQKFFIAWLSIILALLALWLY